jgi:hypothetical protein
MKRKVKDLGQYLIFYLITQHVQQEIGPKLYIIIHSCKSVETDTLRDRLQILSHQAHYVESKLSLGLAIDSTFIQLNVLLGVMLFLKVGT